MKLFIHLSLISFVISFFPSGCCKDQKVPAVQNIEIAGDLPSVLPVNHDDLIESRLRFESVMSFDRHQLPADIKEWESYKPNLRNQIIRNAGIIFDPHLLPDMKETASIKMKGYTIKNIYFQTLPGIYATANLYIPDGQGPFPAVIHMLGHWEKGKIDTTGPQAVGHSLALNGYVCLTIDPWGSGERSTIHGQFEDHGDANNLGTSLLNIGETLLGIEISENIRGVDLLCSLPYVDPKKIGATGASGGGNQTMWLTAIDERIRAAVPVVSVGTFSSYIMGTPCICEVMENALTITEEAGILALIAPRAVKMCNHNKDANPAFFPAQMLRTYSNVKPVFTMLGAENSISYQLFDLEHGYMPEDRREMLGWFDLHLKGTGNGTSKKEVDFRQLAEEKLMVFQKGERDPLIITTEAYCKKKGNELRSVLLDSKKIDSGQKKKELMEILNVQKMPSLIRVNLFPRLKGWDRLALETSDDKLIPVLMRSPSAPSKDYVIVCNPGGKQNISRELIKDILNSGSGIAIVDLYGTGEASFARADLSYDENKLRVLMRSELWFGRTIPGEWVKELNVVYQYLKTDCKARKISIDGSREAGLAAIFMSIVSGKADAITLRDAPVSYLFDNRASVDFFSSGIFLKGILNWGDISLAAALSGKNIHFIHPVTMSGQEISDNKMKEYRYEFEKLRNTSGKPGKTTWN